MKKLFDKFEIEFNKFEKAFQYYPILTTSFLLIILSIVAFISSVIVDNIKDIF